MFVLIYTHKEKIMILKKIGMLELLLVILALLVVAFIFQKADSLATTILAIVERFK
jgi:hypothetical protein